MQYHLEASDAQCSLDTFVHLVEHCLKHEGVLDPWIPCWLSKNHLPSSILCGHWLGRGGGMIDQTWAWLLMRVTCHRMLQMVRMMVFKSLRVSTSTTGNLIKQKHPCDARACMHRLIQLHAAQVSHGAAVAGHTAPAAM